MLLDAPIFYVDYSIFWRCCRTLTVSLREQQRTAVKGQQSMQSSGLLPLSSGACYLSSVKKMVLQFLEFVLCTTSYSSASSVENICSDHCLRLRCFSGKNRNKFVGVGLKAVCFVKFSQTWERVCQKLR